RKRSAGKEMVINEANVLKPRVLRLKLTLLYIKSCVIGCPDERIVPPLKVVYVAKELHCTGCCEISLDDTIHPRVSWKLTLAARSWSAFGYPRQNIKRRIHILHVIWFSFSTQKGSGQFTVDAILDKPAAFEGPSSSDKHIPGSGLRYIVSND
nr:hydroxymethylglutaryl-CoA lyase, mitochondrial-like [Tanacetum cinerariifolium]